MASGKATLVPTIAGISGNWAWYAAVMPSWDSAVANITGGGVFAPKYPFHQHQAVLVDHLLERGLGRVLLAVQPEGASTLNVLIGNAQIPRVVRPISFLDLNIGS